MSPQAAPKTPPPEEDTPEKRALRVERIKSLIQLSSSPGAEGQQAAKRACDLIRKFDLDIVDPVLVDGLYKELHHLKVELEAAKAGISQGAPLSPGSPNPFGVGGGFGVFTSTNVGTSFHSHQTRPFGGSPGVQPQWPPTPPPPPPQQPPMQTPVAIPLKFRGRCKQCGKSYDQGDTALWIAKVGIWCPGGLCYQNWYATHQAASQFNPFGP